MYQHRLPSQHRSRLPGDVNVAGLCHEVRIRGIHRARMSEGAGVGLEIEMPDLTFLDGRTENLFYIIAFNAV